MTKLNYHYKDRQPLETVKIIQNFFKKNNYNIICKELKETTVNTWGCTTFLYYNDILVLRSNGKGLTKEFALASAYAELYERFCNKINIYRNAFLNQHLMENNYLQNKYFLNKQEKEVSFENFLNLKDFSFFKEMFNNDKETIKLFIDFLCNKKYIQVPYKNYITNEKMYISPILLTFLLGSNGMASGNSFEEAYNQGLNEIFERYVIIKLIENENLSLPLYKIKKESIKNLKILNIINAIEKDNNVINLYDFSYNFNVPVVGGFLCNKESKTMVTVFGSFPIFDIAIERVLTEMYQNRESYSQYSYFLPFPEKRESKENISDQLFSSTKQKFLLDIFLQNNNEIERKYNESFYLQSKNYSNKEIFNWNNNLCKKYNYNIYVIDNSLDSKMFALQIYSPELSNLWKFIDFSNSFKNEIDFKIIKYSLQYAISFYKKNILFLNNKIDKDIFIQNFLDEWKELLFNTNNKIINSIFFFVGGRHYTFFAPFGTFHTIDNQKDLLLFLFDIYENNGLQFDLKFSHYANNNLNIFKKDIFKFGTLQRYSENYTYEELKKLFSFFNETLTLEEYNNRKNSFYIISKIFFEPYQKRYNKKALKECLSGFVKNEKDFLL